MNYRNEFIGNGDQLMTVTEAKICQGRQEGVKEIRIDSGGDLSVSILSGTVSGSRRKEKLQALL